MPALSESGSGKERLRVRTSFNKMGEPNEFEDGWEEENFLRVTKKVPTISSEQRMNIEQNIKVALPLMGDGIFFRVHWQNSILRAWEIT